MSTNALYLPLIIYSVNWKSMIVWTFFHRVVWLDQ